MRGVNKVMLIGNRGKDPDVQLLEGNIGIGSFFRRFTQFIRSGRITSVLIVTETIFLL